MRKFLKGVVLLRRRSYLPLVVEDYLSRNVGTYPPVRTNKP